MTEKIRQFKFPSWKEFSERNESFLERQEYKGYHIQIPVSDNLYLLIDCQNESVVFPTNDNVIRFAWCTKNEFAITSVKYVNCEEGYLMGCAHLINMANEFSKSFEYFARANIRDIRSRIENCERQNANSKEEKSEDFIYEN